MKLHVHSLVLDTSKSVLFVVASPTHSYSLASSIVALFCIYRYYLSFVAEKKKKSLLDSVDFTRYMRMDPDLFDFGPLTLYFLRDNKEELFAEAAVQLIDEIFSQTAVLAEQRTGRLSPAASEIPESSVSQSVATTSKGQDTQV